MNPTRPTEVRDLLRRLDFKPSRVLGQNFLIDGNILRIMLDAAELTPADKVLEVGPGLGVLTAPLLERAGHVLAIEKDDVLHAHIQQTLGGAPNFTLIHGDALHENLPAHLARGINKVVANLPYSVGTRILVDLCHAEARPERMVVTVQREVADRMTASPNTKDYGVLSVFAQADYKSSLHKAIAHSCFFPVPQIESAIVLLVRQPRACPARDERHFRALVKRCFEQRRKQIHSLVKDAPALERAGLDPKQRPETLSVDDWIRLSNELSLAAQ
ncbi:MAG: 16S rRNA (adenine(1518)-N(6)/adenine(1519)-N(6))-dimethyltransferase RsmA [Kiritimatiellae bacterium]|nr:16S rRNA (adenine(1518)-N(6)/adenine(1519)-N(6))-dimethyltransferase RsmA [Kiritimatiellia bacterium]